MSNPNETIQSNTSCYVDEFETGDRISYPVASNPTQIIPQKPILMAPLDGYGKILLENLLKQLSEKINHYEETRKIGDCHVIPINVPLSEASLVNYEIINFTDSLMSFPCMNYHTIIYFSICCKNFDRRLSKPCNGHSKLNSYFIAVSNSEESFGCNVDEYMNENRRNEWQLMKNNSSLLIRMIFNRNFIFTTLNLPFCTSIIHKPPVQYLHCACISTEPIEFNFSCTLQIRINLAINLCWVIYKSLFDRIKLFLANIKIIFSMTLSINPAFFFVAATFPIKNSGFDFYSKRNLQLKELAFRMEIKSDISSLKTFRSGSSDPDSLLSSQHNSYNVAYPCQFQSSVPKDQQIFSLFKTNFNQDESVSSKCSIKSFQSKTDESLFGRFSRSFLRKIPLKIQSKGENKALTNSIYKKSMKTFSSTNQCEKDYSQGTLTELKSKYLLTEQSSKINHLTLKALPNSINKQSKTKIKNNNFSLNKLPTENQIKDCLVINEALLSDSVLNECLSIIFSSVSTLIASIAAETWNMKSLFIRRDLKSCQFVSSGDLHSKIRNNYQNYIFNRRNKIGFNKSASSSLNENRSSVNNDFLAQNQKRKGVNDAQRQNSGQLAGPNICDLITSQSLFGQPPKSCFKSKLSGINKLNDIRNLSWDVEKLNLEKVQKIEEKEIFNNRSVKLDVVKEPDSIFDYAKARCLSVDLSSKLNLTNDELIRASKQPFSHSEFLKTLKEDLLSKRTSRLSDAPIINNIRSRNSYLNRKRVQSNLNRNKKDSKTSNSKFNYRVTEKGSRNMVMNRFKTENKPIDADQDLSKQQGKLLFSQNRRKGEASFKSSDSTRDGKNIFCFS